MADFWLNVLKKTCKTQFKEGRKNAWNNQQLYIEIGLLNAFLTIHIIK